MPEPNIADLQRLSMALNEDHHRRMTEAYLAQDPGARARALAMDDASYRHLLAPLGRLGGRCLELGSAAGRQLPLLLEVADAVWGVDPHAPSVQAGRAAGYDIVQGFAEDLPFPDETFDLVCSRHVMEHTYDYGRALAEIRRVLKPGGYVAAVTPHVFPDPEPAHTTQLTINQWVRAYEAAGFAIVRATLATFNVPECHILARKPLPGEVIVPHPDLPLSPVPPPTAPAAPAPGPHRPGAVARRSRPWAGRRTGRSAGRRRLGRQQAMARGPNRSRRARRQGERRRRRE